MAKAEFKKTDKMASRPDFVSALLSMLKRITSVFEATARLMSPSSMASLILGSKNSTACLPWPEFAVARYTGQ